MAIKNDGTKMTKKEFKAYLDSYSQLCDTAICWSFFIGLTPAVSPAPPPVRKTYFEQASTQFSGVVALFAKMGVRDESTVAVKGGPRNENVKFLSEQIVNGTKSWLKRVITIYGAQLMIYNQADKTNAFPVCCRSRKEELDILMEGRKLCVYHGLYLLGE